MAPEWLGRSSVLEDIDHDRDLDHRLDLKVVRSQSLQAIVNDGAGTLVPSDSTVPISKDGHAMTLADVTDNGVSILQGNADGTVGASGLVELLGASNI